MSKAERPRGGMLLIACGAIALVSYIVCAAAACGGDHPEAVAPSGPFDAQAVNDDTYAIGDASTGGGPFGPSSTATIMPSATALKPSLEPTTSAPKTNPPRPKPTSGNPPPPPKSDSPPPGRHKPI